VGVSISTPVAAAPVDLASIRALFKSAPGTIYLDTATYGLPPQPTVDALNEAIAAWQAGSASWRVDWDEPADECRASFASLVGAKESEVARIPAAAVGMGLVAASLKSGDEVVVPDDEFTSTLFPILVAERRGVLVRQVPFADLAEAIRDGTKLVAASLVQMQTGKMVDLDAILGRATDVGARVALDATQGVPFVPLDDVIGRVDYLVCAAYKHLLCPRGVDQRELAGGRPPLRALLRRTAVARPGGAPVRVVPRLVSVVRGDPVPSAPGHLEGGRRARGSRGARARPGRSDRRAVRGIEPRVGSDR
jgi:hypothetical protein